MMDTTLDLKPIKDEICDICHKMWQLGWVAANDGNVSVRLSDGTFLATANADLSDGKYQAKVGYKKMQIISLLVN